jgi:MSHA biogenesis protein MshK
MAERLTFLAVAVLAASFGGAVARAEALLVDPTRPPAASATATQPAGEAPSAGARLQSVLISPARTLAVIDGKSVPLGGRIGGATLVSVSETGVTLRRGAQLEILKLHPNVQRRSAGQFAEDEKEEGGQP